MHGMPRPAIEPLRRMLLVAEAAGFGIFEPLISRFLDLVELSLVSEPEHHHQQIR